MNRIFRLLLLSLLLLLAVPSTLAQTPVTALQTLAIDFWPDYDQASVLVLMTGTLPAEASLPAEVSIPLPPEATLHVVARVAEDGGMSDDVIYTTAGDRLIITLPENRFRVEYYLPYTTEGSERSFSFTWQSDLAVATVLTQVQQPVAATTLVTEPTAVSVAASQTDGFVYHVLPTQAIPAGEPYTVSFSYTAVGSQLSVDNLPAPSAPIPAPDTPAADSATSSFLNNWLLLLGATAVFLVVVVATWIVATRRAQSNRKPAKPRPVRPQAQPRSQPPLNRTPGAARFCHECGAPLNASDQFCRQCGTAVKK